MNKSGDKSESDKPFMVMQHFYFNTLRRILKAYGIPRRWPAMFIKFAAQRSEEGGRREAERGGREWEWRVVSFSSGVAIASCRLLPHTHLRSFKLECFSLGASIPCFAAGGPTSQNARVTLLPDTMMAKELRCPGRWGLQVP